MIMTNRHRTNDPAHQRRETVRRLQIGGVGLALVLLLVALATVLTGEARQQAEVAKAQAEAAGVANPGTVTGPGATDDPLAKLGVERSVDADAAVPTAPPPVVGPADPTTVIAPNPIVPDLQPDPDLKGAGARR